MSFLELIAWSFINLQMPLEIVDVVITRDLRQMRSITKRLHNSQIRIVAMDDLIKMKENTGRKQDDEDVKALRRLK